MPNVVRPRQVNASDKDQIVTDAPSTGLNFNSGVTSGAEPSHTGSVSLSIFNDQSTTVVIAGDAAATSTEDSVPEASESSASKSSEDSGGISTGLLIGVCVAVAVLVFVLSCLCVWRRKREKRRRVREEERQMHLQQKPSWGEGKTDPTRALQPNQWEEFKEPAGPGQSLYPPPPDYLLRNTDPYPSAPKTRSARRVSVKSTVTGKVNPSNNFAVTDENYDDDDDGARSTYTAFSPTRHDFHDPSATLTPLTEPGSFLSFHSGMESMKNHDFLQREAPSAQPVPSPQRSLTTRSQDGSTVAKKQKQAQASNSAINQLLVALDTSALEVPTKEAIDKRLSRGTTYLPISDDGHQTSANPFQSPSPSS